MQVEIDPHSGYCFGVEFAIQMAEDEMEGGQELYCLGDIVHNAMEVERLYAKGLRTITREELEELHDCKVLIRAHGEPPETYETALKNNIELIDASCPVVLKLQNRIKHSYDKAVTSNGQVVIYGKPGHAEVIGLTGQTNDEAIIITSEEDLDQIDFARPVTLYSQTTKSTKGFYHIKELIEERIKKEKGEFTVEDFNANDSICRQVSNREPKMVEFSHKHDVVLFVSGKKSSNGRALYNVCLENNTRSYFIENETEIDLDWIRQEDRVGICGATSTPRWLMEKVADFLQAQEPQLAGV
ncbi:4-hydroxy-3-methylbut-2-enyl diphosphate reductase [Marinoscillum sp. 108]|uniref:4-hydroxy-3-methylbut-2-enyl diphosphate reductase n=1 Tax=Marinoscillum sp. 108 TaxID=2653151 RepID=UPI0012F0ECC4|nr:4-hydroxy-3-methylbut-2-enyl diphosphate reductase [Marinoscillum sp. 108]VXD15907.1 4-hydroxy-3-methylbut-2-enyl diphosphate reductase [Marinoscillum sp. 108]